MSWTLVIDANEQAHYQKKGTDRRLFFERNLADVSCQVRAMDVCDYVLAWTSTDAGVSTERALVGVERATMQDMASKIVDGRYKSQSQRMVDSGIPVLVWAITDGPLYDAKDIDRVHSAMTHLAVAYPRTRVTRLENGDARMAKELCNLMRYVKDTVIDQNALADAPLYTVAQERGAKVRMDTHTTVYREQLTIPYGMSHRSADAVIARAPTMLALFQLYAQARAAYLRNTQSEQATTAASSSGGGSSSSKKRTASKKKRTLLQHLDCALEDVPVGVKRLGPALSARIRQTLLPDQEVETLAVFTALSPQQPRKLLVVYDDDDDDDIEL